jgi:hypothetical protein
MLHTDNTENTAPVLCDMEHAQAARTQRKDCCSIVGRVCCGRCLETDLHVNTFDGNFILKLNNHSYGTSLFRVLRGANNTNSTVNTTIIY